MAFPEPRPGHAHREGENGLQQLREGFDTEKNFSGLSILLIKPPGYKHVDFRKT